MKIIWLHCHTCGVGVNTGVAIADGIDPISMLKARGWEFRMRVRCAACVRYGNTADKPKQKLNDE